MFFLLILLMFTIDKSAYSILIKMGAVDQYSILTTDDLCTECTKDQVQGKEERSYFDRRIIGDSLDCIDR